MKCFCCGQYRLLRDFPDPRDKICKLCRADIVIDCVRAGQQVPGSSLQKT